MDLEIWGYIFGGAAIFALIMGVIAWVNGRVTRRFLGQLIVESRQSTERLIREIHNSLQQSIERIQQSIEAADKRRSEDTKYLAELISQTRRL